MEIQVELAALIFGVPTVGIAVWSLATAIGANRRASAALDLQSRVDARSREFREVSWHGRSEIADDLPVFQLTNIGLTAAESVTLILDMPRGAQAFNLGTIPPGGTGRGQIAMDVTGTAAGALLRIRGDHFRVHWSSPLGYVETYRSAGMQLG